MRLSTDRLLREDKVTHVLIGLCTILMLWWVYINLAEFSTGEHAIRANLTWAACYQILAIIGGISGLFIARPWGLASSAIGRVILCFALGLMLQAFGQTVFSYYNLFAEIEVPYPSIADFGFFGSIPLYIYGILLLARLSGATFSLQYLENKIQVLIVPLIMLVASYTLFLRGYEFDFSAPVRIFLDFGYPLGQAIYVSLAFLTYSLSKNYLGGIMRAKVIFILGALFVQYIADYNFLYQAANGTWLNGGYGDAIYLFAYFLMALGLQNFKVRYLTLK